MARLLDEITHDLSFIRSHTLQPRWYKLLKVLVLVGFLVGYGILFGLAKTVVFLAVFISLSLAVHMLYRGKTARFTRSWLDFVVADESRGIAPRHIGPHYYVMIAANAIIAIVISQVLL